MPLYVNHDPSKQIGYLQQCLSNNKRPLGLFVGAGCPMSIKNGEDRTPLIPDMVGITKVIRERLADCAECGEHFKSVEGHFKSDGCANSNIEQILSHVRSLRAVAGADKVRGLTAKELDALDGKICDLIHELADKALPNSQSPYHRTAAWIDAFGREKPIEIFTTNYDLLIEQALEHFRIPFFDGFVGAHQPFFDLQAIEEDVLPTRWVRLWKLHGSINWHQIESVGVVRGHPKALTTSKRVIHPSHLKYQESRRMPYLAMIDRLRTFIKQPTSVMIFCGYSFRDEHLNEAIIQALQSTPGAMAFALLFGCLESYPEALRLALARSNLTLLAKDKGVIGGHQASWVQKSANSGSSEDGLWVKRTNPSSDDSNAPCASELLLGDFAVFGQFLHQLTGTVRNSKEAADGE